MICEKCGSQHKGSYGSGRFCGNTCARSYSTAEARIKINKQVSIKLRGVKTHRNNLPPNATQLGIAALRRKRSERLMTKPWEEIKQKITRKKRVLAEQNGVCAICGMLPIWCGKPLTFHYDHIKTKSAGESRDNVRMICPNCHAQTLNYGGLGTTEIGRKAQREAAHKTHKIIRERRAYNPSGQGPAS